MPDTPNNTPANTLLSFDYGRRRIGIAVGQAITQSAGPLGTARNGQDGPDWTAIDAYIEEWCPDLLVVGMPYHADGSVSDMTEEVQGFADELRRFGIPLETVDERFTSLEAEAVLRDQRAAGRRGRVRKEHVDATAAVIIAQRWLLDEDAGGARK